MFMDRAEHKHAQKKEQGQYPAILTKQAFPVKDLLYGLAVNNGVRVMGNPDGKIAPC